MQDIHTASNGPSIPLIGKQPSVEVIVSRIQSGASNGDIILMHIGGINTAEAIDRVIPILKGMGFNLVTLTELLDL